MQANTEGLLRLEILKMAKERYASFAKDLITDLLKVNYEINLVKT